MKILLVFALCGIASCLAGPTCKSDELSKCSSPPGPKGSELDELNKTCREIECTIEVYDRCGAKVFGNIPFPVKNNRKLVYAFCEKSSPLRKEYLRHIKCIRSVSEGEQMKEILKKCGLEFKPKEEFCRELPDKYNCVVDYFIEKCGEGAGAVVRIGALPYLDMYDCLSD